MGMALPMGGHLTHGWNVSITGSYFTPVQYGVRKDTDRIDFDEVRDLARKKERPKLLWAGGTAYPRIDFESMALDRARGRRAVLRGHRPHRGAGRRRRAPVACPASPTS